MKSIDEVIYFSEMESPIGKLRLSGSSCGLAGLHMQEHEHAPEDRSGWVQDDALFVSARRQLTEYFQGRRQQFDLPLDLRGTDFQRAVWAALCEIPFGQTLTYGEQAKRIGNPKGMRAVGAANGRNPIAIIVPCHRVIGADGTLTGYAGGIERKRWLLAHEGHTFAKEQLSLM